MYAQSGGKIQVSGNVSDSDGEPLAGVTVSVKGQSSIAVATDLDGNYKINVPGTSSILEFNYIGMQPMSEKVGDRTVINVVMINQATELDDVIVIGYGVQKKVNSTGSIQNVKADDINQIPSTNLSNSLAGRIPGATIVGNSGLMGASSDIRIRGGFGEPLFVIDGIIRDKESFDRLEPNEIDQLSFLKDAASTSIYGSAAGNGVVLVTTKSGSSDEKPVFNYQGSYAFSKPTQTLFADRWTAIEELDYQNSVSLL
ncbi:MAG: TonB-dependent receptor plug domain-containing protein [Muribaculaceae bacterium]|nr:TonB-dependent receptor plug domain-containing protein [Muribaculaceae bacterium]